MHQHHEHQALGGAPIDEDDYAVCPVMNIPVSKKEAKAKNLARTIKDKEYYLCCNTCRSMFDKNPEQYA